MIKPAAHLQEAQDLTDRVAEEARYGIPHPRAIMLGYSPGHQLVEVYQFGLASGAARRAQPESGARRLTNVLMQRRAALVVGAGSVLMAMAGCGAVAHPAAAGTGVVAWVDRPAPAYTPSPQPTPRAEYPSCHGEQLRAGRGITGAATGNVGTSVRLTNVSKAACTLSGYPTILIGITPTGEQESLRPEHGGMFADETAWPANLRPGRSGAVVIATSDACPALNQPSPDPGQPFVGAIIGLPGGGAIRASAEFNAACGVSITTLGELAQPFPQTDVALTVTLRLPTLIRPGRTLHYAVSLMNPTPHPVSLRPCPAYLEGVFPTEGTTHTEVSYYLNCDRFGSLMPGRSITFAMQVPIPNVAGPAKFGWQIPAWGYLGHAQLIRIG